MRACFVVVLGLAATGCQFLPERTEQPAYHNPFPQLSKVAVAPFINLSTEPTVDGRQFALAYFNELQSVPGFEVVPVGVVERAMTAYGLNLSSPQQARQLAQILDVDAVVVGAVTEYSPYYPPQCGLHVEWFAANPCFNMIPPGYGLPLGTPEEEEIPENLLFEAEMALARAQLEAATPSYPTTPVGPPPARPPTPGTPTSGMTASNAAATGQPGSSMAGSPAVSGQSSGPAGSQAAPATYHPSWQKSPDCLTGDGAFGLAAVSGDCVPHDGPVIRHTRVYHGNAPDFTAALENYYTFRDEARFGGWQGYLQRDTDFIRFCCHMHIAETLTARGGADETRVLFRWRNDR